ncbi:Vsp/OspC family lipoprotein [Borrelia miyamotoi]|uniref:Vsp/OspC family lipoprotein n=1 Tax=Borrelia miyamotoi TaxID=47466 RepID=UPI000C14BB85|nr:Vsp/OspC family lipoprotein [Borrelia miyamotoi]ATQ19044.1 Vsp/OspC family lipoprotein [Borrelia miyamotoi]WVI05444.1 Vsp/OspC family lipoprotein [Borrelia miyamotoi]
MSKRKTLSAIKMTLFLIINIVMISCGSGGPAPKEGQAAKADGTVIDLVKVSTEIKDAIEFAASVKEVETLIKSVDELAKAIGKKIKDDGSLEDETNHNGSLVTGVYQLISDVKSKLTKLETVASKFAGLKEKVSAAKVSSGTFLDKLKGESDLRKEGVTDAHAKSAILVTDVTKDKGANELIALNTVITNLVIAAKDELDSAISKLTAGPAKSNAGN